MIANENNLQPLYGLTPEEETALRERASAPTVRNLRAAASDLFTPIIIIINPDAQAASLSAGRGWRTTDNDNEQ